MSHCWNVRRSKSGRATGDEIRPPWNLDTGALGASRRDLTREMQAVNSRSSLCVGRKLAYRTCNLSIGGLFKVSVVAVGDWVFDFICIVDLSGTEGIPMSEWETKLQKLVEY